MKIESKEHLQWNNIKNPSGIFKSASPDENHALPAPQQAFAWRRDAHEAGAAGEVNGQYQK